MSALLAILRVPAVFGLLLVLLVCSGCGQTTARQSAPNPTVTQVVDERRAVIAHKQDPKPAVKQPAKTPQPLLFADDHPEPYRPRGPPGLCVLPFFPAPLVLPPLILPADLKMPGEVGVVVERVVDGQHVVAWAAISPVGWRVGAVQTVGFRYYNPVTGRYISRDPIGYGDGMNVYCYVHNNPINSIDPLGLSDEKPFNSTIYMAAMRAWLKDKDANPYNYPIDSPQRARYLATMLLCCEFAAKNYPEGNAVVYQAMQTQDYWESYGTGQLSLDTAIRELSYDKALDFGVVGGLSSGVRGGARKFAQESADVARQGAKAAEGDKLVSMNPRKLTSRQGPDEMSNAKIDKLAKDMKKNGYDKKHPITAWQVGDQLIIKDGHHRARAAAKAGIDVPVKIIKPTPQEAAAAAKDAASAAAEVEIRRGVQ